VDSAGGRGWTEKPIMHSRYSEGCLDVPKDLCMHGHFQGLSCKLKPVAVLLRRWRLQGPPPSIPPRHSERSRQEKLVRTNGAERRISEREVIIRLLRFFGRCTPFSLHFVLADRPDFTLLRLRSRMTISLWRL